MIITLKKKKDIKQAKIGFSWTVLFFGFFVPLLRGDWLGFTIMVIMTLLSMIAPVFGFAYILFPFLYNKYYIKDLLKDGYKPASKTSKDILESKGFI